MNWQTELNSSFSWLLSALGWTSLSFVLVAYALKFSAFGKKFWLVVQPCWVRSNKTKTIGLIVLLLTLILLEVRISVLNSFFYNGLYSSLQDKKLDAFWFFATINAMLVLFKIIHSIINYLMRQVFEIRWLEKLNEQMLERWLQHKNYYRLKFCRELPDNMDQRIEQDARDFISGTVELVRGVINSVVSTIEFTIILWGLSGVLLVLGLSIDKGVVFFIYLFIILATSLSIWIGYPLIKLNFRKEQLNGDYRYSLIRVRDNAESVAFYNGESQELDNLHNRFKAIIQNRWAIVRQMLGLDGFNTGVTQVAMFLPLMLQAPRFFAGQVTLGDMHQTVQSFNRLMRALSFFRLFYEEFTLYQARLNRLFGFFAQLDELDEQPIYCPQKQGNAVIVRDFTLNSFDNSCLLQSINLQLIAGDAMLIQGPSGAGKTSLLKAIAGIYPFQSSGEIILPENARSLFLPQRPYMPQGTLRQGICYPHIEAHDDDIKQAMADCRLHKYINDLDKEDDWQVTLSPGELQRVAFVRILLAKPDIVFLDETTSALDEPTEELVYRKIRRELPAMIILSVGHRNTLVQFHNKQVYLTCAAKG